MIKLKTEADAYLVLSWISDISDQKTNKFLSQNGCIATITQISGKKPENNAEKRRLARLSALTHIDYLKELLAKETINYISPQDPQWPNQLIDLGFNSPFGLFTKGDQTLLLNESISIAGTRKSTVYGNTIAAEFAFDLATIGFNIVSGGAIGIDTSSHHGALNAQGKTICVQANGLSKLYPSKNDFLFQKINNVGLIISEYPPGRNPVKNYFLDRNRIIAALSKSTIVVEAAEISGALSTARHALRMQRLVMVVPG